MDEKPVQEFPVSWTNHLFGNFLVVDKTRSGISLLWIKNLFGKSLVVENPVREFPYGRKLFGNLLIMDKTPVREFLIMDKTPVWEFLVMDTTCSA